MKSIKQFHNNVAACVDDVIRTVGNEIIFGMPLALGKPAVFVNEIYKRAKENPEMLKGKTGGAYPRRKDGSFDRARGWGWYVGWAEKDGRTLVFARLAQDETRQKGSPGIRVRKALLADWPALAARALASGQ